MFKFTVKLERGDDPLTGLPVFGFERNGMFITDPLSSECGRFEVDPQEAYGISKEEAAAIVRLNTALKKATQDALDAGCFVIQEALGVTSGDVAGVYFSGGDELRRAANVFFEYAEHEIALAQADDESGEER